jgi:glutaredoxin
MNIIIYSTTTCAFCRAEAEWLDNQNIKYEKKVVDQDQAAMNEFMSVNEGQLGVPLTIIKSDDGKEVKVLGFDKAKLSSAIGL